MRDTEEFKAGPEPAKLDGAAVTERGQADPALVNRAVDQWRSLPGLPVSRYRALWGGTPPGTTQPVVVIVGESPDGGVQVCALVGDAQRPVFGYIVPGEPARPGPG